MKVVSKWKRYLVQAGWRPGVERQPNWSTVASFRFLGSAKRYARSHDYWSKTLQYRVIDTKGEA